MYCGICPHGPRASYSTDISPIHATHSPVTCVFGHDHVEETMGYEHTVEVMSLKRHFCADTIITTKEIEGNGIFAHAGPNIKRMNLNINIVEKEVQ